MTSTIRMPTPDKTELYLSSIDELVSNALSNGLDVPERSLTSASAQQPDSLLTKKKRGSARDLKVPSKRRLIKALPG